MIIRERKIHGNETSLECLQGMAYIATNEATPAQVDLTEWVEALPDTLLGCQIDKGSLEVCDPWGNFLFPLPSRQVMDFGAWLQNEINDYKEANK